MALPGLVAFGPCEAIVGDGRVMSATETAIAEDDAEDVADAEMVEEVVGFAELAADVTKFSKTEIRSKRGWSEV